MCLENERKWAIDTIEELQHEPIAFELDPAAGHVKQWWRSRISDSDIFLLLIDSDISNPVFDEVETARRYRKRVFVFAKDEDRVLRRNGKSLHNLNLSDHDLKRFYGFITNTKYKAFQNQNDLRTEIIRVIASLSPKLSGIPESLIVQDWELQRINALYVPPIGKYEKARNIVESNRFLIIAGPPHVGKTSMAYFLLSFLKEKYNLDVIVRCTEYRDVNLLFREKHLGVLLDDPFGKVKFESTSMGQYIDEVYKGFAKKEEDKRNFVILTSRAEVFEEARENTRINEMPPNIIVQILQEGDYSTDDLVKILCNHLDYCLDRNMINHEEYALTQAHAQRIVKSLRFPHNIGFFVENFVKGLTTQNIETVIENAGKIREEVEKWYNRMDKDKDYELRFFVFTAALLPDSEPSAIDRVYDAFIDKINTDRKMKLAMPPISYMRSKCSTYITEVGLVNFRHPSYLEGIINAIRKQQSDDLILFLRCIEPIIMKPVSPFQPLSSQRLTVSIWDAIHVLRVSASTLPDYSLKLLENLMKNAKERGIIADIFGIIEQIGQASPASILPLLEELAKIDDDDLRHHTMHAMNKVSEIEPDRTLASLRKLVHSKAWFTRPYVASILGEIGIDNPDAVLPILEELMLDRIHYGKSDAAEALIGLGKKWPSKVTPLIQKLAKRKDKQLEYSIEWIIGELQNAPPNR